MCYTLSFEKKALKAVNNYLKDHSDFDSYGEFDELYYLVSGFAHPKLPVIKHDRIEISEWGLIPFFASNDVKAGELAKMTLNARSDTIFEKTSFRNPIKKSRCILPVDGFFEWHHKGNKKYPFYIYPSDGRAFYMACIYNTWLNRESGEVRDTFSIITTDANSLMAKVHNSKRRMPLILSKDDLSIWNDPSTDLKLIKDLMQPYSSDLMLAHTISADAGNYRKNRNIPEIKNKVAYAELSNLE